jgi:hypothetical protein
MLNFYEKRGRKIYIAIVIGVILACTVILFIYQYREIMHDDLITTTDVAYFLE